MRLGALTILFALALFGCGEGDEGTIIGIPVNEAGSDATPDVSGVPGGGIDAAAPSCAPGETQCSGRCVPVQSDPMNCGGCGAICPSGSTCAVGMCILPPSST